MAQQKKPRVLALVTAKGTNTLKDKHLRLVNCKCLIEYPLIEAKKCKLINDFCISSDSDRILGIGMQYGYMPIKRPAELATATSPHNDTIKHALNYLKEVHNKEFDIVIVLLGNSVYFDEKWITESINIIEKDPTISSVIPVYQEDDYHPFRAKKLDSNGFLVPYFDFKNEFVSTNRQESPKNFFCCHNFWTLNVNESIKKESTGQAPWRFMGSKLFPLFLDKIGHVHDEEDLQKCEEYVLKKETAHWNKIVVL